MKRYDFYKLMLGELDAFRLVWGNDDEKSLDKWMELMGRYVAMRQQTFKDEHRHD